MDIFIPIGVGFLLNIIIYLIIWGISKRKDIATTSTLASFIILLALSFVIGKWIGMGLAVVSIGMLLAYILLLIMSIFANKIHLEQDHTI